MARDAEPKQMQELSAHDICAEIDEFEPLLDLGFEPSFEFDQKVSREH